MAHTIAEIQTYNVVSLLFVISHNHSYLVSDCCDVGSRDKAGNVWSGRLCCAQDPKGRVHRWCVYAFLPVSVLVTWYMKEYVGERIPSDSDKKEYASLLSAT